jgi:hypothetical protein
MARQPFDPSSKWMLEEQGASMLSSGSSSEEGNPRRETFFFEDIISECRQQERVKVLHEVLEARFGVLPPTVTAGLQQVKDQEKLVRLSRHAATCPSLQAFEDALRQELSPPPPASTRGKRRSRKAAE